MAKLILGPFLVLAAFAQTPTIEQSLSMRSTSGAQISPDGRFVAYTVQQASWDQDEFVQQIWVSMVATGERYQLTSAKKSSQTPKWSPDSKRLAFASERDGKRQIYIINPLGGEPQQLTSDENGVSEFEWAPDGSAIAYISSGPESKAKKDRKEKYGDFEVVEGDYAMMRLWLVKAPAEIPADPKQRATPEPLTEGGKFSVEDFSWSPDAKLIAFSAQRDPALSSSATQQIYLVDLADKHVRKLLDSNGPNRKPRWSQDGRQIAFNTANGDPFYYYSNLRVAVAPIAGGQPKILTANFDEDANLIDWGPDGIYFSALQKGAAHVFRVNPENLTINRISGPDSFYALNASFTPDHRTMAAVGAMPNHFAEVLVSPVKDFSPRYLTAVEDQWKNFQLTTREMIEWKSTDGTPIQGVLVKPHDYDPSRKYPLLVVIHGGPTGMDTLVAAADRYYPVERFAAKGALVLKPNYRGSAGYGEKFRALNVRNLGLGDYADVISGVDYLITKGMVDKDRVGAMGWSEGGYISAFITTYSDRFRAVSVGAGISDWTTYYVNTDIHPFTRQYLKATPWEDPGIYQKTSPIYYINNAKTPTLIQHGDQDKRVPPPNSFELYQALKDRGVPVKLILYKGFGHPIDKPKQQRAVMEHNYDWFAKYIWGEDPQQEAATK
ncbi:MAG TPA: S9 family peptidase [Bryobacteraceae bacterium]|nr:S9 family peptidase [Bryobacteraceae bacterium]